MNGAMGKIRDAFANPSNKQITLDSVIGDFAGAILVIGYTCAVCMVFYIAIKYLIAKPAEKAQLKMQLTYLFIGAALLTCGTTILGIVGGAFNNMFK